MIRAALVYQDQPNDSHLETSSCVYEFVQLRFQSSCNLGSWMPPRSYTSQRLPLLRIGNLRPVLPHCSKFLLDGLEAEPVWVQEGAQVESVIVWTVLLGVICTLDQLFARAQEQM